MDTYANMIGLFGTAWHVNGVDIVKRISRTTYDGDPTSNLDPEFQGQFCEDTANNALYWASGTTAASWKKLTP